MSRNDDERTMRMCRYEGRQPTMRDRWTSFYRVYRMCCRVEKYPHNATYDALMTLLDDTGFKWLKLVNGSGDRLLLHNSMPLFLRKEFLRIDRKRRLFPTEEHRVTAQKTARTLEKQGIEVTSEEVAEVRCKVIAAAKRIAAQHGYAPPLEDDDILRMLKRPSA